MNVTIIFERIRVAIIVWANIFAVRVKVKSYAFIAVNLIIPSCIRWSNATRRFSPRQIRKSCCAKYNFRMDNFRSFKEVFCSRASHSFMKLRVVFNAPRPTSTNVSINDCLHVGPKLQNEICSILLRWR